MAKLTTIYLQLMNEGTLVYRPVMAEEIGNQLFKIISENTNPEDEEWQFNTGDVVHCEFRTLEDKSDGEYLVAIKSLN